MPPELPVGALSLDKSPARGERRGEKRHQRTGVPPKPRLPLVQESGGLRVDEEEIAERGGGRALPVGLPDAVGGGVGGRDAPPHPVAVPKGGHSLALYFLMTLIVASYSGLPCPENLPRVPLSPVARGELRS